MYQSFPLASGQHVSFNEPRSTQSKVEKMLGTSSPAGSMGRHVWPFLATYGHMHAENTPQSQPDSNSFIS